MEIIDLRNIERKSSDVYYMRVYIAQLYDGSSSAQVKRIEFKIELTAFGERIVYVNIEEEPHPSLNLLNDLKEHILNLDLEGKLP